MRDRAGSAVAERPRQVQGVNGAAVRQEPVQKRRALVLPDELLVVGLLLMLRHAFCGNVNTDGLKKTGLSCTVSITQKRVSPRSTPPGEAAGVPPQ